MKRKNKIISVILIVAFIIALIPLSGTSEVHAEDAPEIATWEGWRKAAATFTFDDGAPSHYTDAAPLFDKYGYKATFNLVVNWNPNWTKFQELADNGHEIGSHSNSHPNNMSGEEASSKANIEGKITSKYGCITVAYPNCNVPNETAVLNNYIAGRIGNGSWVGLPDINSKDGPSNWCKVSALMTGAQAADLKTSENFISKFQAAGDINGWVVFLTHGFAGKSNGNATYSPTDINAIEGALKWANENDSEIWISTMCNVAMYIKERKASTFVKSASTDSSITYTLTHEIADDVCDYQYPLSVRVPAPEGWDKVKVTQNDTDIESEIKEGKIYFQAVPNGGDIVISNITPEPTPEPTPTPTPTAEPTPTLKPEPTPSVAPTTEPTTMPTEQPKVEDGVGTISADGKTLTDEDGTVYFVAEKISVDQLNDIDNIADKKTGGKYTITGITKKDGKVNGGTVSYIKPYNKNCKSATIKDTVKIAGITFKITSMSDNAFKGCTKLTKVTIGKNVTKIGKNAFNGCKSLKNVIVKATNLKKIGSKAFKGINSKAKFKLYKKKYSKYKKMIKKAKAPKTAKYVKK